MRPNPIFIRFEERLKEVMTLAERETGFQFPILRNLVRTESGVLAAKRLLSPKDRFSEGFKKLANADCLKYTLEAVVLEFRDSNVFLESEIDTAEWRLKNADKVID